MGYIKHHAIVVTSSIRELIISAHEKAKEIFGDTVSNITPPVIKGYESFFIAPDGNKEGWQQSNVGDEKRKSFIEWVNEQAYEDGGNSLDFCEVFYGEDNGRAEIVSHN